MTKESRFDLQLFAEDPSPLFPALEEEGHEGEEEFADEPEEGETETEDEGPDTEEEDGNPSEAEEEPPQETKTFAGKYKSAEDLERAYVELQRKLGERDVEKETMKQQLAVMSQILATGQNLPQNAPKQEVEELSAEELLEQLYSDPKNVLDRIAATVADKKVEEKLAPIRPLLEQMQQAAVQQHCINKAAEVQEKYPDFQEMIPEIQKIMDEDFRAAKEKGVRPKLADPDDPDYEMAYKIAKANKILSQTRKETTANEKQAARLPSSAARRPGQGGGEGQPPGGREKKVAGLFDQF
jgi:hypothetical protein